MKRILHIASLLAALSATAFAQGRIAPVAACFPDASARLRGLVASATDIAISRTDPSRVTDFMQEMVFIAAVDAAAPGALDRQARPNARPEVVEAKTATVKSDAQIASGSGSSGGTSLVQKPDFARILGVAIDNGAVTSETSGTTLKLSTSPYAFAAALFDDTSETYTRYGFLSFSIEGKTRSPFLSNPADESRATYSLSTRYQRMPENAYGENKKADIAQVQFRVEFPIQSGISLPISFTYANSAEEIHEDYVRANFGLSFNADKLLALARMVARQ